MGGRSHGNTQWLSQGVAAPGFLLLFPSAACHRPAGEKQLSLTCDALGRAREVITLYLEALQQIGKS